ncbi:uroporphyrinogen-III synthase [Loktanella sp. DJP18]|uniref:uroporphyrinogen-III synthase n=1 Tax=Loktanella sp. DJP18 TaxID=3409788 RepID=UPI003BB7C1EC
MDAILIMTRPAPAGTDFADTVTVAYGHTLTVIQSPALRIEPLPYAMPDTRNVVFTSARAVEQAPPGDGLTAWCVGRATAEAAEARGYATYSADGDAESLVALVLSRRPHSPLVHIAGRHRRGAVAARLTEAGLRCTTVEAYDQVPLPVPEELQLAAAGSIPLVAPVFSPRSAQGLLGLSFTAPLHVVAISPAVATLFRPMKPATLLTVGHPDADHMRDMTVAVLRGLAGTGE